MNSTAPIRTSPEWRRVRPFIDMLGTVPDAVPDADEDVYPDWVPSPDYNREGAP